MPNTVANQRVVSIHRERATSDFLGIKNENWMAAARDVGAQSLMLYMYLAANKDGYALALSPAAIFEAIGMPCSTYSDQFKKLVNKGYLVLRSGNKYDFYEVPRPRSKATIEKNDFEDTVTVQSIENSTSTVQANSQAATGLPSKDIEINNKWSPNTSINNDTFEVWSGINEPEEEQEETEIPFPTRSMGKEYIF